MQITSTLKKSLCLILSLQICFLSLPVQPARASEQLVFDEETGLRVVSIQEVQARLEAESKVEIPSELNRFESSPLSASDADDSTDKKEEDDEDSVRPEYGEAEELADALERISQDVLEPILVKSIETAEEFDLIRSYAQKENKEIAAVLLKGVTLLIGGTATEITAVRQAISILNLADFQFHVHVEDSEHAQEASLLDRERAEETGTVHYLATSSGKYLAYDGEGEVASGDVKLAFEAYKQALAASVETDEMIVRQLLNELVRVWDLDQVDPNVHKEAWLESPLQNRSATTNQGSGPIYIPIGDIVNGSGNPYNYSVKPPTSILNHTDSGFAGILGDTNGDGVVTPSDVNVINTYLNSSNKFMPELQRLRADINGDGLINHMDALGIINYLNVLVNSPLGYFPAGQNAGIPNGEAILVYKPHPNYHGVDDFIMEQVDGFIRRAFTVTVTVNEGPSNNDSDLIAQDQSLITRQDVPRGVTLEAEDPNNENNPFTFEIIDGPDNGTLQGFNEDTGQVIYDPNSNFTGTDEFTFRVTEEDPGLKKINDIDACELELDSNAGKQYFIPCDWSGVYRANYDGTNVEKISGSLVNARSLTLDLVNRNAYWIAERQVIRKSLDVAANIIPDSIYTDRVNAPQDGTMFSRELQIDPINEKLYLPHTAVMRGNTYRANLDGSGNFETLESAGVEALVDYQNGRIFWVNVVDATHSSLYVTDLDGNNKKFLIYLGRVSVGDLELDAANQQIYWIASPYSNAEHKLQRINTDGSGLTDLVIMNPGETGIGRMGEHTFDGLGLDLNRREIILSGGIKPERVEFRVDLNTWTETIMPQTLVSNIATVDINVIPDNLPPTANDQMVMTNEDTDVGIQLDGQDPEGDNISYEIIDGPDDGTLLGFNPNTGQLTYRPDRDFNGDDTFTYRVTDHKLPAHILDNLEEFEGVLFPEAHSPEGLVFDYAAGKMYWHEHQGSVAGGGENIIRRANIGGGDVETVLRLGQLSVNDLAIDEGRRLLFWTQHGTENGVPLQKIMRASLDNLSNAVAIHTVSLNHPSTIFTHMELDTANGQIYYLGSLGHDIRRINYDGTNDTFLLRTEFEDTSWSQTLGFALDLRSHERKMYWTLSNQSSRGEIHVANLDGSDHQVLMSGVARVGSIFVDTINDHLYWTINPFLASVEQRFQRMRINVPSSQQLVEDVLTVADTHGFDTVAFNDTTGDLCFGSNYNPATHPPGTGIQAGIYCGNIFNLTRYSEVATVTVKVKPVNDAPVTENRTLLTDENTPVQTTLTGFDLDGDGLNFQIVGQPPVNEGSVACNGALCTFTPANGFSGVTSYTYRANDGTANSNVSQITVIVIPGNDSPQAFDQELETDKNTPLQIQLTGTDPDADRLLFELLTNPVNGTITGFNPQNGTLTFVPETDFVGMTEFLFKVKEINPNALDAAFIDLGTTTNYDAAVDSLTGEIYVIGRASSGQLGHLASIYRMNADGSGKTFLVQNMFAAGFFQIEIDHLARKMYWLETVSISGVRTWLIKRSNLDGSQIETIRNIGSLPSGLGEIPAQQLHPSLELDVYNQKLYWTNLAGDIVSSNLDGSSEKQLVSALVSQNPEFDARYAIVTRNLIVDSIAGKLYWLDDRPTSNTYRGNIYVANLDGTNIREFNVAINNAHHIDGFDLDPVSGTLNFITVTGTPNTQGKVFSVGLDGTGLVEVPTLRNFRQPNTGDGTTASFIDTFNNNRYCWIRPGGVTNTHEVLSCAASQSAGQNLMSQPARIKITIRQPNRAPAATPAVFFTDKNTPVSDTLEGSDVDGDNLTFLPDVAPLNGNVIIQPDGSFTYFPRNGFVGVDTFTFIANDGNLNSTPATVKIYVQETDANRAPVAQNATFDIDKNTTLQDVLNASDPDGNPVFFQKVGDPQNGNVVVNEDGTFSYVPNNNFVGTDTFTFKVQDGPITNGIIDTTFLPHDLTFDPVEDKVYWAESAGKEIWRANMDGTGKEKVIRVGQVDGSTGSTAQLYVDPVGRKLYYSVIIGLIVRSDLDGRNIEIILPNQGFQNGQHAIGLAIDTVNQHVYYTDRLFRLMRINIDGTGEVELGNFGANGPFTGLGSMALDIPNGKIYWTNTLYGEVQRSNLDGSNVEVVVTGLGSAANPNFVGARQGPDDVIVDSLNGKIYWTDRYTDKIQRSNLDGSDVEDIYTNLNNPWGLEFDTVRNQICWTEYHGPNNGPGMIRCGPPGGVLMSNVATVTINVHETNDPPVGGPQEVETPEDTPIDTKVGSDPDGDTLNIMIIGDPTNGTVTCDQMVMNGVTMVNCTYTPDPDFNGMDMYEVKLTDPDGEMATSKIKVNVTPVNDPPTTQDKTVTTPEDIALNFSLMGSDIDNDPLTFMVVNDIPAGQGTLTCDVFGNCTYTPPANFNGVTSFTFKANDGQVDSNVSTVTINVTPVNDAPTTQNQTETTPEDTPINFSLNGADIDGDALSYMVVSGIPAGQGSVSCNATGNCTYTPPANFIGQTSFTFKANDGQVDSNISTVTINVTPENDPPTGGPQDVETPEDTPITTKVGQDIDGDTLNIMIIGDPANGTVTCDQMVMNGVTMVNCTYTPDPDFNGMDMYEVKLTDPDGEMATSKIKVNVTPENDPPTGGPQNETTPEETPVTTKVGQDIDGDTLNIMIIGDPANGTVTCDQMVMNGVTMVNCTYTPDPNFNGMDMYEVKLTDPDGEMATSKVTIDVTPVNDAPTTQNQTETTPEDTPISFTLNGNDIDGDTLSYMVVTAVSDGTLNCDTAGNCTYTPPLNFNGTTSFMFKANDGTVDSNVSTVTINVTPVNDAPTTNDITVSTPENTPKAITLMGNDVDGDTLTFMVVADIPAGQGSVTCDTAGNCTYIPPANFVGTTSFTYKANDGTIDSNISTVTIHVNSTNVPPTGGDQTVTTPEDTPITTKVGQDLDGDQLTIMILDQPDDGTVTCDQMVMNGVTMVNCTYTPDPNFNGMDMYEVKFTDPDGEMATSKITVNVTPVNDAPTTQNQTETTPEDTPISFTLNGNDIDGDTLSYMAVTAVSDGTLNCDTAGNCTYTPPLNFNGTTSFMFKANDGTVDSNISTVTINVTPVNDVPTTQNQTETTPEDTPITFNLNGADVDGDTLTFMVVADIPAGEGTVNCDAAGVCTYTPPLNFNGSTSFTFKASDGTEDSNISTVTINVTPVNDVPTTQNQTETTPEDTPITFNLNGTDVDGDTLTFMVVADIPAGEGSVTCDAAGVCTYTPPLNFNGSTSFTFKGNDGQVDSNISTVTINVTPVNDAPTTNDITVSTPENTPKAITLMGNDVDGDTLTFMVVADIPAGQGSVTCDTAGNCTYIPPANFVGTTSFTYKANDGQTDSNVSTVTIMVSDTNVPPTGGDQTVTTPEDTPITTKVGQDLDGDQLTIMILDQPDDGTVTCDQMVMNGVTMVNCTYTPDPNFNGQDMYEVKFTDPNGEMATSKITVNVTPVNDAPTTQNQTETTPEDTPITFNLNGADVDGDALTFMVVADIPAGQGSVSCDAAGVCTYTPPLNFNGSTSFTFKASDGTEDSNISTVTINVTPVNDVPTTQNQTETTPEDTPITFNLNGADVDGDTLTFMVVADIPAGEGSVTCDAAGVCTYTPPLNFNGSTSFTFKANDGQVDSNISTVTINVTPVNDVPTTQNQTETTPEDTPITFNLNGTDVDGDALTFMVVADIPAGQGSVTCDAAGNCTYTPPLNFNGSTSFTYKANDGQVDSNISTVTINVTPVNDPPIANDQDVTTPEDTPIDVINVIKDVSGDTLTLEIVDQPDHGTVTCSQSLVNGMTQVDCTYTPELNYNGPDEFKVKGTDPGGEMAIATITVDVTPVNDAPTADDAQETTPEETPVTTKIGQDVDGDTLTIMITDQPDNGTVTCDQMVMNGVTMVNCTYTPEKDFNGMDMYEVKITDPDGEMATSKVTIDVTPVNDAPTTQNQTETTPEDTPITFNLNGADVDGDTLTFMVVADIPAGEGTVNCDAAGVCTYTPPLNFNGSTSFTFKANDGQVDSNISTVTINVTPVNDAPTTQNQTETTPEDTPITFNLNGTDVDGDTLTFMVVADIPAGQGSVSCDAAGVCTYTPPLNFNGSTSFTFKANDGQVDSNISTVTINVTPVNDAPTADDAQETTPEETPVTTKIGQDVDGDTLTIMITDQPDNGTVTCDQMVMNGVTMVNCTYTPEKDFNGMDMYEVKITDPDGEMATAKVTIDVTPVNDAPEGFDHDLSIGEEDTLTLKNAQDVDGDTLQITVNTQPQNGTLTCSQQIMNGVTMVNCDYTPNAGFVGVDTYKITVDDGQEIAMSTVRITVLDTKIPTGRLVINRGAEFTEEREVNILLIDLFDSSGIKAATYAIDGVDKGPLPGFVPGLPNQFLQGPHFLLPDVDGVHEVSVTLIEDTPDEKVAVISDTIILRRTTQGGGGGNNAPVTLSAAQGSGETAEGEDDHETENDQEQLVQHKVNMGASASASLQTVQTAQISPIKSFNPFQFGQGSWFKIRQGIWTFKSSIELRRACSSGDQAACKKLSSRKRLSRTRL